MLSKLYVGNQIISDKVKTSPLSFEGDNIVTHKLLNGEKVIQHIGELSQVIEVICYMSEANKEIFDLAFKEVSLISLKRYDDFYSGHISEVPASEIFVDSAIKENRFHEVKFTLNIDGDNH